MTILNHDNLIKELSILGKDARLSITQRQKIRDQLFKKMGQVSLIDAVQTQTEADDLVMPLSTLQRLFRPKSISFGIPATAGMVMAVFVVTFATGAFAQSAKPGDPLFGVRKVLETVQIAFTADPANRATLKLNIVNDRIKALETANSGNLSVSLNESKKALASAQASLSTLPNDKDLNTKLKAVIESQKTALSIIAKGNISNDEVKKTVLAMRDQLDKLILPTDKPADTKPADTNPVVATPTTPTSGFVTLNGTIGTYTAKPTLMVGDKRYYLVGATTINLISYMGSTRAVVSGILNGDTITLTKLTINGQLIWEANNLDINPVDNNLSWVEGDQNSSLR